MCVVPLILDRIRKNILEKVKLKGPILESIFDELYQYKLNWMVQNKSTPLHDRLVF